MKKLFVLVFIILLLGCAPKGPDISKLNSLSPGISQSELSTYLGGKQPTNTQLVDGYYILQYDFSSPDNIGGAYPYYFIFDQNNRLAGWEKVKGQGKIVAGGISLLIPMPSRK